MFSLLLLPPVQDIIEVSNDQNNITAFAIYRTVVADGAKKRLPGVSITRLAKAL